jgi:outer membrane lipopolysaccharide assembly protein LptE/RlpB
VTCALLCLAGCGYHVAGAATHIPPGISSLSVPTFANNTLSYRTEVPMTQAVIHELTSRTNYHVVSHDTAEPGGALLRGTILSVKAEPLTYDSTTGQSSSYLITVTAKVVLTDANNRVLYQNSSYLFRQQYQTTQDVISFIQEDSPAVNRLSRDFAATLVSDMLESF